MPRKKLNYEQKLKVFHRLEQICVELKYIKPKHDNHIKLWEIYNCRRE